MRLDRVENVRSAFFFWTRIKCGIFWEGSQISTYEKRDSIVSSLLISLNFGPLPHVFMILMRKSVADSKTVLLLI